MSADDIPTPIPSFQLGYDTPNVNPPPQPTYDIPSINPPPQLVHAVFLSVDSDTPEIVTLQLNRPADDGMLGIMQPNIEKYIPNYWDRPDHHRIPDEKGTVHLYAERSDMTDYHNLPKRNKHLATAMDGKEPFKWRGPIMVMRKTGRPETGGYFQDANFSDLITVINDFKTRNSSMRNKNEDENPECMYQDKASNRNTNRENRLRASGQVKGVMISCLGDMGWWLGQEQFCQALLGPEHSIFGWSNRPETRSQRSSILLHMGLPVHLKQIDPHNSWAAALLGFNDPDGIFESYRQAVPGRSLGDNIEQYYLRVETGIHVFNGKYGNEPQPFTGPVLMVREDKREITPHQVEALAFFCRYVAHPKILELKDLELEAHWIMLSENKMTPEQMVERADARERLADEWLCWAKFEEFFKEFKRMKLDAGYATWAEVKSPFTARALCPGCGGSE
jgi:hypothetical protein